MRPQSGSRNPRFTSLALQQTPRRHEQRQLILAFVSRGASGSVDERRHDRCVFNGDREAEQSFDGFHGRGVLCCRNMHVPAQTRPMRWMFRADREMVRCGIAERSLAQVCFPCSSKSAASPDAMGDSYRDSESEALGGARNGNSRDIERRPSRKASAWSGRRLRCGEACIAGKASHAASESSKFAEITVDSGEAEPEAPIDR